MSVLVKTAIVTGRHPYDVQGLHQLFRGMDGIDPFIQHTEDFVTDPRRTEYDAVVLYNFHHETPGGETNWWEQGMRECFESFGETSQGVVVLHHAILAFPQWQAWAELVGIEDRKFDFFIGETVTIDVADPDHPITAGLNSWSMVDETYLMASPAEGADILLTCDHEKSMKAIAWTRQHKNARVLCLQSGHDNETYVDTNFQRVLGRGIQWVAGRL